MATDVAVGPRFGFSHFSRLPDPFFDVSTLISHYFGRSGRTRVLRIAKFRRPEHFLLFISSFLVKPASFAPAGLARNSARTDFAPTYTILGVFGCSGLTGDIRLGPFQAEIQLGSRLAISKPFSFIFDTESNVNVIN